MQVSVNKDVWGRQSLRYVNTVSVNCKHNRNNRFLSFFLFIVGFGLRLALILYHLGSKSRTIANKHVVSYLLCNRP